MDLRTEYLKQQDWRNWNKYISHIPLSQSDCILDLGCSVGGASKLFSEKAKQVVGIDVNPEFIEYCNSIKAQNETFYCIDFLNIDFDSLPSFTGVWASFSLSYLENPQSFLQTLLNHMEKDGWIALIDVSGFISGNMDPQSSYYETIIDFEKRNSPFRGYDFEFGIKMKSIVENAGFKVVYQDGDVEDQEFNFDGRASNEIIEAWNYRLERMPMLRLHLEGGFKAFKSEFLEYLMSDQHERRKNLKFLVAKKLNNID